MPGEGLSLRARGEILDAIRACPHRLRTAARIAYLRKLAREHGVTVGCIYKYQARAAREARP
jgi:DNA repair ATPase RecN